MRVGGCPVAVAQWQSTGDSSQVSSDRLLEAASLLIFLYFRIITCKIPLSRVAQLILGLTPNEVLTVHVEWLPGVQLRHSVQPVQ